MDAPLIQPLLGATFTRGNVSEYFDTDKWELDITKCKLYTIKSQEEFDFMVKITNKK